MNLGADDYLIKPVSKDGLMASIRFHLERAIQQTVPEFEPISSSDRSWKEMLGLTTLFPSLCYSHGTALFCMDARSYRR
ncbi:MAG: response regulator transcription factor [Verrucomicrobia bacterium]|nr:response regulator transcription factor [Verrucomicrobiota bacterium]